MPGSTKRRGDWAIAGGLAQGLGGIGAGVAAAVDTQIKNAQIRERNAQRDIRAAQLYSAANQFDKLTPNLISLNQALEGWRVAVDGKTDALFRLLRVSVGKINSVIHRADITFSMGASLPFRVDGYLKMSTYTEKGRLIDDGTVDIRYKLNGVQEFQTYRFYMSSGNMYQCTISKYDSDVGNAKQIWNRTYTRQRE